MDVTQKNEKYNELRDLYLQDLNAQLFKKGNADRWEKLEAPQNQLDLTQYSLDRIWVWSDHHFGHKNIIDFSNRPFSDVTEMREHMVLNYQEYVNYNDVCFWVGDVAFLGVQETNKILDRCPGHKILIAGNHDFDKKKLRKYNFDEVHLLYELEVDYLHQFVFTHYPFRNLPRPRFNIHGHTHTHILSDPFRINVCVENTEYKPMRFTEIVQRAVTLHENWLNDMLTD